MAWRAAPSLLDPFLCIARSLSFAEWNHCQIPFFAPFHLGQKCAFFKGLKTMANWQGRSSGSPALLATFPSRLVETVVFAAKRVLSLYTTNNKKSRVTAAGPLPSLTGFPIKLRSGFKTPSKAQWLRCKPPVNAHILTYAALSRSAWRLALGSDLRFWNHFYAPYSLRTSFKGKSVSSQQNSVDNGLGFI